MEFNEKPYPSGRATEIGQTSMLIKGDLTTIKIYANMLQKNLRKEYMGYYCTILIVFPHERIVHEKTFDLSTPSKRHRLWKIESILNLGHVTGSDKFVLFKNMKWTPRRRAAVCAMVGIIDRVLRYPVGGHMLKDFAPPFAFDDRPENPAEFATMPDEWLDKEAGYDKVTETTEYVEVLQSIGSRKIVPDREIARKHNKVIQSTGFKRFVNGRKFKVIEDAPLFWMSCRELDDAITKGLDSSEALSNELSKDGDSVSYLQLWRQQLIGLDKFGARAILLFKETELPDVI